MAQQLYLQGIGSGMGRAGELSLDGATQIATYRTLTNSMHWSVMQGLVWTNWESIALSLPCDRWHRLQGSACSDHHCYRGMHIRLVSVIFLVVLNHAAAPTCLGQLHPRIAHGRASRIHELLHRERNYESQGRGVGGSAGPRIG